jgi:hypothetical protein
MLDVVGNGVRDWKLDADRHPQRDAELRGEGGVPAALRDGAGDRAAGEGSRRRSPGRSGSIAPRASSASSRAATSRSRRGTVSNATPVDVRALPAAILGITSQPVLLGLQVPRRRRGDPAVGGAARGCRRAGDAARRDARAHDVDAGGPAADLGEVSVRNNRRQFLRLALPKGAELWSASVGGRAVQPARAATRG